ncbi:MAG: hypothetical protein HOG97_03935 [Candidatus Marinimicrobia bacterium]|nr:hypothetical protein [Candidatus Neomarinimicrobiota bacterium]
MKKIVNLIFVGMYLSLSFSQTIYNGDSSFDWDTGWFGDEGDFEAIFSLEDILAGEYSGSLAVTWPDSVGATHIFIPSIEPADTSGFLYNLFLMYMKDSDGIIEPQTWDVGAMDAIDFENLDALMMYREDVDSVLIAGLINPFLTGEADFSDMEASLLPMIIDLALESYVPINGEITLDEVTGSGFSGSFDGSFIMASSVSFMTISNGSFVHTIPGSEFLPGIPQSLTATVSGTEVDLNWTLNDDWFTSNYYVYHSNMANDGFEYLASVDATTSTVIHNDPLDGNNYYYITAANLVAIESNPSNTAMVFVEASTYNMGDVNMDDTINVLDIVILVNFILDQAEPTELQFELSDLNGDGGLNVLDIVQLVNIILEQ